MENSRETETGNAAAPQKQRTYERGDAIYNGRDGKLARHAEWCYQTSELRKKYTRQGSFESSFAHLDYANAEGEGMDASDGGAGAERIRSFDEPVPRWLALFNDAKEHLPDLHKRVVAALLEHKEIAKAAREADVSRPTVYKVMEELPRYFGAAVYTLKRDCDW